MNVSSAAKRSAGLLSGAAKRFGRLDMHPAALVCSGSRVVVRFGDQDCAGCVARVTSRRKNAVMAEIVYDDGDEQEDELMDADYASSGPDSWRFEGADGFLVESLLCSDRFAAAWAGLKNNDVNPIGSSGADGHGHGNGDGDGTGATGDMESKQDGNGGIGSEDDGNGEDSDIDGDNYSDSENSIASGVCCGDCAQTSATARRAGPAGAAMGAGALCVSSGTRGSSSASSPAAASVAATLGAALTVALACVFVAMLLHSLRHCFSAAELGAAVRRELLRRVRPVAREALLQLRELRGRASDAVHTLAVRALRRLVDATAPGGAPAAADIPRA